MMQLQAPLAFFCDWQMKQPLGEKFPLYFWSGHFSKYTVGLQGLVLNAIRGSPLPHARCWGTVTATTTAPGDRGPPNPQVWGWAALHMGQW